MKQWKRIASIVVWMLLSLCVVAVFFAAGANRNKQSIKDIQVQIVGSNSQVFVDEKDILHVLSGMGISLQQAPAVGKVPLKIIEQKLAAIAWVATADAFITNTGILKINITEREPLLRLFTLQGNSFYIDSGLHYLPLSAKLMADVPVFTSFPAGTFPLSKPDSLVLLDVVNIAKQIKKDSFWLAQIAQTDILPNRTYECIPTVGSQIISLGTADSLQDKFARLFSFYKHVWAKQGIEKYEKIDVQYQGQVVAIRRGAPKPMVDTTAAVLQLVKASSQANNLLTFDSVKVNASTLPNSLPTKSDSAKINANRKSVTVPSVATKPTTAPVKKPVAVAPKQGKAKQVTKPKAVLQKGRNN
jgi:cell division protein FtsQ